MLRLTLCLVFAVVIVLAVGQAAASPIRVVTNESLAFAPTPTATATVVVRSTPRGAAVTVRSTVVNVRTGPSTAYPLIGQVKKGQVLEVSGQSRPPVWWQIVYPGPGRAAGQKGWISGQLVVPNAAAAKAPLITSVPPPPTPRPRPTSIPTTVPATVAAATATCPSWYQRPAPGKGVLVIENHDTVPGPGILVEEVNVPGQYWVLPKQNDVPSRISFQLDPGRHTFIVEILQHSRRTVEVDVEAGRSYVSPITRDMLAPGCPTCFPTSPRQPYPVYVMEPPAGCS